MTQEPNNNVRVRFAPSPTGYLHIGGARTAIFNWLFARHYHGKFLLRIEDTDFARSDPKMVQAIYDGLKWLGLNWDENPTFQSQRLTRYNQVTQQLIENNLAYYCYCDRKRLAERRNLPATDQDAYQYDGHCRYLTKAEKQKLEAENLSRVLRFKTGPGNTKFHDEIHGSLTIDNSEIDDFIIIRSDGIPTYNFAVVVDDYDMKISHVIRGDDHLSNTPKQIMLYLALNWEQPKFAHVPLILGADKKRLSKRHGATAVSEFESAGYLPETMLNFLALLGWSPGDNREILTKEKLIQSFELKGISKKSAIFDEAKLIWMNGQYISKMDDDLLLEKVLPILRQRKIIEKNNVDKLYMKNVISLLKSRIKKISDFAELGRYFFKDPDQYEKKAVEKHWSGDNLIDRFSQTSKRLVQLNDFKADKIELVMRELAEQMQIGAAKLIHPLRLALTGYGVSPGLFEVMEILGKETIQRRINKAINWLQNV